MAILLSYKYPTIFILLFSFTCISSVIAEIKGINGYSIPVHIVEWKDMVDWDEKQGGILLDKVPYHQKGYDLPLPDSEKSNQPNRINIAPPSGTYIDEASVSSPLLQDFLGSNSTLDPPDTMGAVGPNHLLLTVRGKFLIQDKSGNLISSISLDAFWNSVGGQTKDPKTFYDENIGRYITVAFASSNHANSAVLVGVSASNDPTQSWYLRSFEADPGNTTWADYPNIGFNSKWIVVACEMYGVGQQTFRGNKLWILNKSDMAQPGNVTPIIIPTGFDNGGKSLYPCVTYGSNPDIYIVDNRWGPANDRQVRISRVTGPINSPGWELIGFADVQKFSSYNPDAPQPGTSSLIQIIDSRVVNAVFRNGSIWYVHHGGLPETTSTRSVVLWHQVSTNLQLIQQGVIDGLSGSSTNHYFYPSIAVTSNDDVGIGFSASNSVNMYGSAGFTYRHHTDPPNTMRPVIIYKNGVAPYTSGRWGDYSATCVDPIDQTIWTLQQAASSGSFRNYVMWWGQFNTSSIITGQPPVAGFYATPTSGTAPLSVNFTDTSANNPTSWNWNFGDGFTSTSQNPNHIYNDIGISTSYTVRLIVSNPNGTSTSTRQNYIHISSSPPNPPSNLIATAISSTQIRLIWRDNSTNEIGFQLDRDGNPLTTVGSNITTFIDNNLQPDSTYCYRVKAYSATQDSGYSNESCATTFNTSTVLPFICDDFNINSLSQYMIIDEGNTSPPSNWSINTGVLVQSSNIWDGDANRNTLPKLGTNLIPLMEGSNWMDYNLECKLRSSDDDGIGIIFRYQDINNYYRFSMDRQRFYRRLVKKVNGVWSLLAQDSVSYNLNQWYDVKITVSGETIQIFMDDSLILSTLDSSIPNGSIGLYSWGQQNAYFDDLCMTPLTMSSSGNPSLAPSHLIATAISSTEIELNWQDNSNNEIGFIVQRDNLDIATTLANQLSYLDPGLSSGINYCYTVRSFNESDDSDDSNQSCAITFSDSTGELLFSANFAISDLSQWTVLDEGNNSTPSGWTIINGELYEGSNIWGGGTDRNSLPKPGTNLILSNIGNNWTNYEFTLRIKSTDDDSLGVLFHYQDSNNYYRFSMDRERSYRRLVKKVNGTFTLLSEDSVKYLTNTWYDLKIRIIGSSIEIYMDNNLILSANDSAINNGTIGLYCWGEKAAYFDDIQIMSQ